MTSIKQFYDENPDIATSIDVHYDPRSFQTTIYVDTTDKENFTYLYKRYCWENELWAYNVKFGKALKHLHTPAPKKKKGFFSFFRKK